MGYTLPEAQGRTACELAGYERAAKSIGDAMR